MSLRAQLRPVAFYVDNALMALQHGDHVAAGEAVFEAADAGHSRQHIEALVRDQLFQVFGPACTKHVGSLNAGLQIAAKNRAVPR